MLMLHLKKNDQVPSFLLMNCLPHLTFVAKVQDAYQILEELRDPTIYDASSEESWAAEGSRELGKRSKACNAATKTECCNKTGPFKSLRANHHAEKHELYLDFWPQKTESCPELSMVNPHFARGPNGDPTGRAAALGRWTAGGHRMEFRLPQLCGVSAEARQQGVQVLWVHPVHLATHGKFTWLPDGSRVAILSVRSVGKPWLGLLMSSCSAIFREEFAISCWIRNFLWVSGMSHRYSFDPISDRFLIVIYSSCPTKLLANSLHFTTSIHITISQFLRSMEKYNL